MSLSWLLMNVLPSFGLEVSEKLGLVMIGVAGGVKRELVVVVGEDATAGATGGVRRDGLGTVVAAGWLSVVDE